MLRITNFPEKIVILRFPTNNRHFYRVSGHALEPVRETRMLEPSQNWSFFLFARTIDTQLNSGRDYGVSAL